ncbi:MAG: hypothetical protein K2O03_03770, partial [Lachnospiraceae bacterium]|nr:hypothetical protein [Lachnospiraceae bacterium]
VHAFSTFRIRLNFTIRTRKNTLPPPKRSWTLPEPLLHLASRTSSILRLTTSPDAGQGFFCIPQRQAGALPHFPISCLMRKNKTAA